MLYMSRRPHPLPARPVRQRRRRRGGGQGTLRDQAIPNYLEEVTAGGDEEGGGHRGSLRRRAARPSDLYDQAVAVVSRERKASTSYIQRYLQIGYNRAASLIERMEKKGVVSHANHAGKREILAPPRPRRCGKNHGDRRMRLSPSAPWKPRPFTGVSFRSNRPNLNAASSAALEMVASWPFRSSHHRGKDEACRDGRSVRKAAHAAQERPRGDRMNTTTPTRRLILAAAELRPGRRPVGQALAARARPAAAPLSPADAGPGGQGRRLYQDPRLGQGPFVQTDARGPNPGDRLSEAPRQGPLAYDGPDGMLVVADGNFVSISNPRLKTFERYPLERARRCRCSWPARSEDSTRAWSSPACARSANGFALTPRDGKNANRQPHAHLQPTSP